MTEKALLGGGGIATTATASTTWYGTLGAQGLITQLETTEARVQYACRTAGTLKNLRVNFGTNARTTASVVTIRVNGAPTALTVSTTPSTAGVVVDTTHTVAVVAGDLISYSLATDTGVGNIEVSSLALELESAGQAASTDAAQGTGTFSLARFFRPSGTIVASSTEAAVLSRTPEAVTLSNLQAYISANASTGFTITSRKNGAAGAQTISVGNAVTGLVEDTTNSDSLAAGDTFAVSFSNPAASVTVTQVSMKIASGAANHSYVNAGGAGTLAATNIRYSTFWGTPFPASTEARAQVSMPFAADLSGLWVRVDSNASTTDVIVVLRVGGVDTAQTLTVPTGGGANVFYVSVGAAVTVAAGDLISVKASGATTGSVVFSGMGLTVAAAAVGGGAGTPSKTRALHLGLRL